MGPYDKPFSPQEYLMHYGVKGMKWGVRRYQNKDGTLTKAGKERYSQNQQDGVDSFLKSVGSKKVSELTGSVNEDLAIQAVTYVSAFAAVLAVKAVQNRMLRKGRMKELDRLNREKDIKDFDEFKKEFRYTNEFHCSQIDDYTYKGVPLIGVFNIEDDDIEDALVSIKKFTEVVNNEA